MGGEMKKTLTGIAALFLATGTAQRPFSLAR
jgi:hypothetical protein